jgi:hypothetical protein
MSQIPILLFYLFCILYTGALNMELSLEEDYLSSTEFTALMPGQISLDDFLVTFTGTVLSMSSVPGLMYMVKGSSCSSLGKSIINPFYVKGVVTNVCHSSSNHSFSYTCGGGKCEFSDVCTLPSSFVVFFLLRYCKANGLCF